MVVSFSQTIQHFFIMKQVGRNRTFTLSANIIINSNESSPSEQTAFQWKYPLQDKQGWLESSVETFDAKVFRIEMEKQNRLHRKVMATAELTLRSLPQTVSRAPVLKTRPSFFPGN